MVMRFADADVLPYDFTDFADTARKYTDEVKTLLKNKQEEARNRNQDLDDGVFTAISDPRRPTAAPPREEVPPFLNFSPLENALAKLDASSARYAKAMHGFSGGSSSAASLQELNTALAQAERKLTNNDGLPRRPWFKHLIYAPGFYTGYGAKTLPGIREAIEEKRYSEAEQQIPRVAKAIDDFAAAVDQAAGELESAGKK
jgi:N-acetylated-alpha-linked acidic dipeptidase